MSKKQSRILGSDGRPMLSANTNYAGATQSRRVTSNWFAPHTGPNSALITNIPALRNRVLAAIRNTPFFRQGLKRLVSTEIGIGIRPESLSPDIKFGEEIEEIYADWTEEADADGVLGFYGLQALIARSRRQSGEVFVRFRPRNPESDLALPFQIQVLEADFCPLDLSLPLKNGRQIKHGIEFNKRMQRTHLYFYKKHPAEYDVMPINPSDYLRIPAREILHSFQPLRPGQIRGEPEMSGALLTDKSRESYEQNELSRKETRSGYTGILTREEYNLSDEQSWNFDPFSGEELSPDAQGFLEAEMRPGTIMQALPGEKMHLFDGDKGGENYPEFMRSILISEMAAMGIPYEVGTGDWGDANDRVMRSILNIFYREIAMDQHFLDIGQVLKPIWKYACDIAVTSGRIKHSGYADNRRKLVRSEWTPHAHPYVHPLQDIQAAAKEIESGIADIDEHRRKRNRDPKKVDTVEAKAVRRRNEAYEAEGLDAPGPRGQASVKPEKEDDTDSNTEKRKK